MWLTLLLLCLSVFLTICCYFSSDSSIFLCVYVCVCGSSHSGSLTLAGKFGGALLVRSSPFLASAPIPSAGCCCSPSPLLRVSSPLLLLQTVSEAHLVYLTRPRLPTNHAMATLFPMWLVVFWILPMVLQVFLCVSYTRARKQKLHCGFCGQTIWTDCSGHPSATLGLGTHQLSESFPHQSREDLFSLPQSTLTSCGVPWQHATT